MPVVPAFFSRKLPTTPDVSRQKLLDTFEAKSIMKNKIRYHELVKHMPVTERSRRHRYEKISLLPHILQLLIVDLQAFQQVGALLRELLVR